MTGWFANNYEAAEHIAAEPTIAVIDPHADVEAAKHE